ncbi:MAG TPA: hypothetical protein VEL51_05260 [Vicinamibacterales bacterium]|nr:hypothetical protein [Vicinamibacterales bacterium]
MRKLLILSVLLLVPSAVRAADPGSAGPLAVAVGEYTFGDTAFTPTGFPGPVEVTGRVFYPASLSGGPYPLLVFLHGRHSTCYMGTEAGGTGFLEWPCTAPRQPIPSYRGYDYVASVLASHGYIVVSIGANGINAKDNLVFDLGAQARAELIQHHLDLWSGFNTSNGGPFGGAFVGKVDLNRVGTMGHSRGGEGVVRHYLYNKSLGSPYTVTAVFPLAPVDFSRPVINNVALSVLLPYCDGDVADLQGVHFFDDARYNVAGDAAGKHTVLVMGANHNFYNTIWTPEIFAPGSVDDWNFFVSGGSADPHCGRVPGNQRLTPAQQRGTALAYMSAFFRTYVGGENFAAVLSGDAPPPPSAQTSNLFVSYHAPAAARRDVNRLLTAADLTTNTLGGSMFQTGITPYDLCGGEAPQPRHCLPTERTSRQPHTTISARSRDTRGLSQLRAGWTETTASIENDVPAGAGDVTPFLALQFRASVNFADARNASGVPQDLTVTLTDRTNHSATVRVGAVSGSLFYPPGEFVHVPKVFLNTVRIPLGAFSGIDLTDIATVRFNFDRTASGALLISDLAFAR